MVLLLPDDLGMDDDSDVVEAEAGMFFSALYALVVPVPLLPWADGLGIVDDMDSGMAFLALYALVVSVDDFLGMVDDDSGIMASDSGMVW